MRWAYLSFCILFLGCDSPSAPEVHASEPASEPIAEPVLAPAEPAPPSNQVRIPRGMVNAGSPPGTPFRRPSREADGEPLELAAFSIDRLPYPNEPLSPPRLVSSRAEAAALCAARDARLCTELEWERACEGDSHAAFPGGATWSADRCSRDPDACASEFGVLRLGENTPEWTASDVPQDAIRMGRSAVQRGARSDASIDLHRCDSRVFEAPESATPAAFRCCHGELNSIPYPTIHQVDESVPWTLSPSELRTKLRSIPELAPFADSFEPYGAAEMERSLSCDAARAGARSVYAFANGPFVWSPSPGEEVWVMAGRSAGTALLIALYPLPDGRLAHASSFVLEAEDIPIAIARNTATRHELEWSTCWGQTAEGGVIRFGDDSLIRITQR